MKQRSNKLLKYLLLLVLCLLSKAAIAESEGQSFSLKEKETIVFFGDSITQNGTYVNYFEAYLLTRFPTQKFRVINHGINSETISGTTEEDHTPPRPWALPRFERDVTKWKPSLVVSCFGMNDGNYYPFEETRYKKYQEGNRRLIKRVHDEAKARLIILTPPPFDPYRRKLSDPEAKTFGYKFPAINYDETLHKYSEWLLTLRKEGQPVVDLHASINKHLQERRKEKVSFHLSPDAVHPNSTGHWLMAQHLLLSLHAPADVGSCQIDVLKKRAFKGKVENLKIGNVVITFDWTSTLPMPMESTWDEKSIALEKSVSQLNLYQLQITGLLAPQYQLEANGLKIDTFSRAEFSKGINLLNSPTFPTVVASQQLLKLVKERRGLVYKDWRSTIAQEKTSLKTAARVKEINVAIDNLRKPQKISIKLSPVIKTIVPKNK